VSERAMTETPVLERIIQVARTGEQTAQEVLESAAGCPDVVVLD